MMREELAPTREARETTLAFRLATLRADTREAERALNEFLDQQPNKPIPYGTVMRVNGFDQAVAIRVDSKFHRKPSKCCPGPGWLIVWADSSTQYCTSLSETIPNADWVQVYRPE